MFNIFWSIDLILELGQLIKVKFERELWKSSHPISLCEYIDPLIQRGYPVIQKIIIDNSCKPFLEAIIMQFSFFR